MRIGPTATLLWAMALGVFALALRRGLPQGRRALREVGDGL